MSCYRKKWPMSPYPLGHKRSVALLIQRPYFMASPSIGSTEGTDGFWLQFKYYMQRKEELLSQLDHALKRKVQEKYLKSTRGVEHPDMVEPISSQIDKGSGINSQKSINSGRSPLNTQKQALHSKLQQVSGNSRLSGGNVLSPKSSRVVNEEEYQLREEIKRLKGRNSLLERELKQLKENLIELQRDSKDLKRQESEYLTLKQENASLLSEIAFLRGKQQERAIVDGTGVQQGLSKIMLLLNISPFSTPQPTTGKQLAQALRSVEQGVVRLIQQKGKMAARMNNFDIDTLLLKENSILSKKELEILRNENEQLQTLIQSDCSKIDELESLLQAEVTAREKVEGRLKETLRQVEALRREFKMTVQASKHSKPKRETAARSIREMPIEESLVSVVKTFSEQTCQTDPLPPPLANNIYPEAHIGLQEQIAMLSNEIEMHKETNAEGHRERTNLLQKIGSLQAYIRGLEFQSEQMRRELNDFTEQLRGVEEEKDRLRQESMFKDQIIDQKEELLKQMREQAQQVSDQLSSAELQLKKETFEKELAQNEVLAIKSQLCSFSVRVKQLQSELADKQSEHNNAILSESQQRQRDHSHLIQLQRIITQKEEEIKSMNQLLAAKETEWHSQIAKLEGKLSFTSQLQSGLSEWQAKLARFKEAARTKMGTLEKSLETTQKQLQTYKNRLSENEQSFKRYEQQTKNTIEFYSLLQKDLAIARQQLLQEDQGKEALMMRIDSMSNQMVGYRCDIQRLSFDSRNNQQLREYYQQVSNDLQSKMQQLIAQLTKVESEKGQLLQGKAVAEGSLQQLQARYAQMQAEFDHQGRESHQLRGELQGLSREYESLSAEYVRLREESSAAEREHLSQIALQNYDIERLVRECSEMKAQIEQLSSLRASSMYKSTQVDQQLAILLQENRTLAGRIEQLGEQLRMKQASIDEDHYLNQLRNRQYCILIRKILAPMQIEGLQECERFEELLERGAEMAQRQENHTQAKRFYIGTEISSSQQMTYGKANDNDEVLQTQSKINSGQQYMVQSPRSFKFLLSPLEESAKEKRNSRLITYFNHDAVRQPRDAVSRGDME